MNRIEDQTTELFGDDGEGCEKKTLYEGLDIQEGFPISQ